MTLQRSRQLAVLVGVVTPLGETFRRWDELRALTVWWPAYVDDILLGGFLLVGAWWSRQSLTTGTRVLSAAWGFMCGMAYSSLAFQLNDLDAPDPSGLPSILVASIKAIGLAVGVVGLIGSLERARPPDSITR